MKIGKLQFSDVTRLSCYCHASESSLLSGKLTRVQLVIPAKAGTHPTHKINHYYILSIFLFVWNVNEEILREKMKKWRRDWKINLIEREKSTMA